jgi:hypothetical protein
VKLAISFDNRRNDHHSIVEKMCRAQCLHESHSWRIFDLPHGAVGCITTSDRFAAVPLLYTAASGNILAVSGLPLEKGGSISARLQQISAMACADAARALAQLDGSFAAFFWDNAEKKLAIVTDFLGNQPLYEAVMDGGLLMATDLKGLTATGLIGVEVDPVGWGAFLALGYYVGKQTSLKGVVIADAGTMTFFDPAGRSRRAEHYWQWDDAKPEMKLEEVDTSRLADQLEQDVRAFLQYHADGTLLLSGGFDSRLILCVLRRAGIMPRVLIHDHPDEDDNADGRYARRIAQQFGLEPELVSPDESYFSSDEYAGFLQLNEMTSPSLNLFIAQMSLRFKQRIESSRSSDPAQQSTFPAMQAVWEGVGPGNSLYPSIQTSGGFDDYFRLVLPGRDTLPWQAAATVFSPALVDEMYNGLQDTLRRERTRYQDDEFGVRYFVMDSRVRNRASANPLKIYANYVLPFTPGLSKDFLNSVISIPFYLKSDLDVYLKLFREQFPEAMSVPWCSGGVLIDANGRINPVHRIYLAVEKMGLIERIKKYPLLESLARRLGKQPGLRPRNPLVERTIGKLDPGHPDLNPDGITRITAGQLPRPLDSHARTLLFYWQMWRSMMNQQAAS